MQFYNQKLNHPSSRNDRERVSKALAQVRPVRSCSILSPETVGTSIRVNARAKGRWHNNRRPHRRARWSGAGEQTIMDIAGDRHFGDK
jgi:hypothetical protein